MAKLSQNGAIHFNRWVIYASVYWCLSDQVCIICIFCISCISCVGCIAVFYPLQQREKFLKDISH